MSLAYPLKSYLTCLDTVRFSDREVPRTVQEEYLLGCRLETLLTLALGQQIQVPEPYSFDSYGFLVVADEVVRGRDGAPSNAKRAINYNPFALARLDATKTYLEIVAGRLRSASAGLAPPSAPFLLSGLASLNNDEKTRRCVASHIERKNFRAAEELVSGREREILEMVGRLGSVYFCASADPSVNGRSDKAKVPLTAYFEHLEALRNEKSLEQVQEVFASLAGVFKNYKECAPLGYATRSEVRLGIAFMREREIQPSAALALFQSFCDSVYNRLVGSHSRAHFATYTSCLGEESAHIERVAGCAHAVLYQEHPRSWDEVALSVDPQPFPERLRPFRAPANWRKIWQGFWEMAATKAWQLATEGLRDAMLDRVSQDKRSKVEDALMEVITVVSGSITEILLKLDTGRITLKDRLEQAEVVLTVPGGEAIPEQTAWLGRVALKSARRLDRIVCDGEIRNYLWSSVGVV